ncbi:RNA polymerase sigma factor [Herbidospora daliensis]|uniref:RNA polymerase sigma factor n=1 Tax=Herbidospora daliensis TaxID=295585 RepID=UPI0012FAECC5|nr:sigma-70 family RNA polymerase sigma factor [Herbidospora daliensis]
MRKQFLDFYSDQYPKVVRFVRWARGADLPAAEDAAQGAFLEAWRIVQQPVDWEMIRNPEAWIRTVALRQHDRPAGMRRCQPITLFVDDELMALIAPSQDDPAELSTLTIDVLNALQGIDDEQARIVMAFTLDDFTDTTIGRQLGIDPQLVRNLRAKARRVLAKRLAPVHVQEGDTAR